ncbi:MAG: hypothetical protein ACE5HB_09030, partial [Terriglobia bacterium]
ALPRNTPHPAPPAPGRRAILVLTAGDLRVQRAKVRVLGLEQSPYARTILLTGLRQGRGKTAPLRRVLRLEPNPGRILVVGDRPDSEIRAARQLKMWTVRRRGGEFAAFRPRNRLERAHFTLRRLSHLFRLPFTFGNA